MQRSGFVSRGILERTAEFNLLGVGDAALGEWRELSPNGSTLHIKRRLSIAEAEQYGIQAIDLRGTPEGLDRLKAANLWLPLSLSIRQDAFDEARGVGRFRK